VWCVCGLDFEAAVRHSFGLIENPFPIVLRSESGFSVQIWLKIRREFDRNQWCGLCVTADMLVFAAGLAGV
jgi:hypothetical protein